MGRQWNRTNSAICWFMISALVCLLLPVGTCCGQTEAIAASKVEALGGEFTKNGEGNVVSVILFGSKKLPIDGFSDEEIDSIDFASFRQLERLHVVSGIFRGITDRSLLQFGKIPAQLDTLDVSFARITDEGLIALLKKQNSLSCACLIGTPITDRVLPAIASLQNLRSLGLDDTNISDKGLKDLPKLKRLRFLSLKGTTVSDVGLAQISRLESLTHLHLDRTKITDEGIQPLRSLRNLRYLGVTSTSVTEKGKQALQNALPNLKFEK